MKFPESFVKALLQASTTLVSTIRRFNARASRSLASRALASALNICRENNHPAQAPKPADVRLLIRLGVGRGDLAETAGLQLLRTRDSRHIRLRLSGSVWYPPRRCR